MTLPKAISDAIDAYGSKSVDHGIHDHYGTDRATFDAKRQLVTDARAALERAIAEHVAGRDALESQCDIYKADLDAIRAMLPSEEGVSTQDLVRRLVSPVDAPTEAEIESWEQRARDLLKSSGLRVQATLIREDGTPTGEELDSPPLAYVLMLREAVALMLRAAAAKKLMECQFGDIGSSKHARYEVYTTPVLGWSVGEPLPNLSVEVDGKVTRYVPEKQGGQ